MANEVKVWKISRTSPAQFIVSDKEAFMMGDENHFIKVNQRGTTVKGPVAFVCGTESIRTGGIFAQLPNMVKMIPSTFVSPIPDQIPVPPIHIAVDMANDTAFFMALLPGITSLG